MASAAPDQTATGKQHHVHHRKACDSDAQQNLAPLAVSVDAGHHRRVEAMRLVTDCFQSFDKLLGRDARGRDGDAFKTEVHAGLCHAIDSHKRPFNGADTARAMDAGK